MIAISENIIAGLTLVCVCVVLISSETAAKFICSSKINGRITFGKYPHLKFKSSSVKECFMYIYILNGMPCILSVGK